MHRLREAWLLGLFAALGCAGPLVALPDGWQHRTHGYRIDAPPRERGWERVELEQATLAYRHGPYASMSFTSRCGRPVAAAQLMARHLLIGVRRRELVAAGPLLVAGRNAWTQTFDTLRGTTPVRIKTVTLVATDCSFDWVLAVSEDFEPAERLFDAWWSSIELDPLRHREGSV